MLEIEEVAVASCFSAYICGFLRVARTTYSSIDSQLLNCIANKGNSGSSTTCKTRCSFITFCVEKGGGCAIKKIFLRLEKIRYFQRFGRARSNRKVIRFLEPSFAYLQRRSSITFWLATKKKWQIKDFFCFPLMKEMETWEKMLTKQKNGLYQL